MNESITMNAEGISNVLHTHFFGRQKITRIEIPTVSGGKSLVLRHMDCPFKTRLTLPEEQQYKGLQSIRVL